MLDRFQRGSPLSELMPVVSAGEVVQLQREVQEVWVEPALKEYIVRLVQRTRSHVDLGLGASARGALGLFRAAQARAALEGRDFVTPDDVKDLALPVLGHRLILKPNAELRGLSAMRLIEQILDAEAVPSMTRRYA